MFDKSLECGLKSPSSVILLSFPWAPPGCFYLKLRQNVEMGWNVETGLRPESPSPGSALSAVGRVQ